MSLVSFADRVEPFQQLLATDGLMETHIQDYLERNTGLIPTPFMLHHELHFNVILSQFGLDHAKIADFAFLTKTSAQWRLVLIELEHPGKTLFKNTGYPDFHHETRAAIAQIQEWKTFLQEHPAEVRRRLRGLMQPVTMRDNPMDYQFVLVIGRNESGEYHERFRPVIQKLLVEQRIQLLTYDSIIRMIQNHQFQVRNILSHRRDGFRFKYLENPHTHVFGYLGPDDLSVNSEQREFLVQHGFDMEAWSRGEFLELNYKLPLSRSQEVIDAAINPPIADIGNSGDT